jgi:hypothetical protein
VLLVLVLVLLLGLGLQPWWAFCPPPFDLIELAWPKIGSVVLI